MELLYLFRENDSVRIPFYLYDKKLYRTLIGNGGIWDKENSQFIFKNILSAEKFRKIIPDKPLLWVDKKLPVQVKTYNLYGSISDNNEVKSAAVPHKSEIPDIIELNNHSQNFFDDHWKTKLEEAVRARKYSIRTLRSYLYYNRLICTTLLKPPPEIEHDDVVKFLALFEKDGNQSASSINLAISAIKFFYTNVMKKNDMGDTRRPKHDKNLPFVLSKTEVIKILGAVKNLKHRLLLTLAYSSGLRVSEVIALKREHIDTSRKLIYVKNAKGRKDRYTILSEKTINLINEYYKNYDTGIWLFPGQVKTKPLTIRSAQNIFYHAAEEAGITKDVSIHSLRHAFATHLLENGTDIRYIQALLGHTNLHTTERYAHVAKGSILNIISPLDSIGQ